MYAGAIIWLIAGVQLVGLVLGVSFGDVHIVAYHQLCQFPSLPASVEYPLNLSLLSVYVLCLLVLIAITCGVIVAVKLSIKNMTAH